MVETHELILTYGAFALLIIALDFWARRKIEFYKRYFPYGSSRLAEWEFSRRALSAYLALLTVLFLCLIIEKMFDLRLF